MWRVHLFNTIQEGTMGRLPTSRRRCSAVDMWVGNGRSRAAVYLPETSRPGEQADLPHSHYDRVGARLTGA